MSDRQINLEEVKGVSLWVDAWRRLKKNKMAIIGGCVVIFFTLLAILANFIAPYPYEETNLPHQFEKQNFSHFPYVRNLTVKDIKDADLLINILANSDDSVASYIRITYPEVDSFLIRARSMKKTKELMKEFVDIMNKNVLTDEVFYHYIVNHYTDSDFFIYQLGSPTKVETLSYKFNRLNQKYENRLNSNRIHKLNRTILEDIYPEMISMGAIFGTDNLGRDMLSRIIYGGRVSLAVGFITAIISFLIGIIFGAISGFAGGRVDNLMMRFVDIIYGLPYMFIVILLMVVFGRNFIMLFIGIAIVSWMGIARITRGQILSLKNNEYIEAAKTIGASKMRIILRHLIPNALGPIIIYLSLTIPGVMLQEAFLSFIGLGVQAPMTSWGSLANEGVRAMFTFPNLILYPGLILTVVLLSFNFVGEGLRDALDPSMKNKL